MAKSSFLGLELTESQLTLFADWRKSVNGNNDGEIVELSNDQIIDIFAEDISKTISEYENLAAFPAMGSVKRFYIALDTGYCYRWDVNSEKYILLAGGGGEIQQATEEILGGIHAAEKTESETAEIKIDTVTGKLYGPAVDGGDPTYQQQIDDIAAVVGNVPSIGGGSSYSYLFDKNFDFFSSNEIVLSPEELSLLLGAIVVDDDQTIIHSLFYSNPLGDAYVAKLLPDTINNLNIVYKDGVSIIPFIKDGVLSEESFEVTDVFGEGPYPVFPALLVDHVVTEDGEKYLPMLCGYAPNLDKYCIMLQIYFEDIIGGE